MNARQARDRISSRIAPTPLLRSDSLSKRLDREVFLKLESRNPTGSFKVRPALNAVLANAARAREHGIVTSSSGNFAQAVAWVGHLLGVSAQIVMMKGASAYKRERTEAWGAEVILCEDTYADRWATTHQIERDTGRLLLHPYDAVDTIAGDGTIGLELLDQLDGSFTVVCPVSGGGLISGISSVVGVERKGCRVFGVQPELNPSMKRSLDAGVPTEVSPGASIADALTVAKPGELTFELVRECVEDVLLVSERDISDAVDHLWESEKVVGEPGGSVAIAAGLRGLVPGADPVVMILSGGNISAATLAAIH